MEQLKLQVLGTGSNEKQSEVDPSNDVPSFKDVSPVLEKELLPNALVWASLHGLVVADRAVTGSGQIPGFGLVHAPFSLFPTPFPEICWRQACDLAPLFNELVDRVSMDGEFLQESLSRYLINHFGEQHCLDSKRVPENTAMERYAEALAHAWKEFNDLSSVVLVVVQPEERNMYDQHWICMLLKESYGVSTVRKTLAEINAEGEFLSNGTLLIGQRAVAVVSFRAGYTPIDYPSEAEWKARLMLEKSSAIKCTSISYHLAGSKKIQQELAKPNVLERFISNKDDVLKLRKCFAGLWSLHNNANIIQDAITRPEAFVLKPQREGGGNNIYGKDVKETLLKLERSGGDGHAAYVLMQRIFPTIHTSYLVRDGICRQGKTVSELGIFSAYLRNKDNVLINNQSGYLVRTKVSSSDEGGIAAGFAVLDSLYLT